MTTTPPADSQREAFEAALVVDLRRRMSYLQHVGAFSGGTRGEEAIEYLRAEMAGKIPSAMVEIGGASFVVDDVRRRRFTRTYDFVVVLAASAYRGRAAGRTGIPRRGDPVGVFYMLEQLARNLAGHDLGVTGVGHILPKGENELVAGKSFTMWEATFSVEADLIGIDREAEAAKDILSIHGRIELPDADALLAESSGSGGRAITVSSSVVTLTDAAAPFESARDLGQMALIEGSTDPLNDGRFVITAVTSTTLSWTNVRGVPETFPGSWKTLCAPAATMQE